MPDHPSPLISRLREIASSTPVTITHERAESPGRTEDTEHCDFCSKPIPPDHRHFADLKEMKFMCACDTCMMLQAGKGEYRLLPQRYRYLKDFNMPEKMWMQFKIPVNMAFFVYHSAQNKPIAFYPSPAGATESELTLDAWEILRQTNPVLEDMIPDLEGFLVNRLDEPHEYFIAPVDHCYKLIGLIKITWKGLHGGDEMRNNVRIFFNDLKRKSVECRI